MPEDKIARLVADAVRECEKLEHAARARIYDGVDSVLDESAICRSCAMSLARAVEATERSFWEKHIRDDFVRAGLDPRGTVGMAQVHLLAEQVQAAAAFVAAYDTCAKSEPAGRPAKLNALRKAREALP